MGCKATITIAGVRGFADRLCVPVAGTDSSNAGSWLDSGGSRHSLASMQSSTVVADEPLTLTVHIANTMLVALTLSRLRLACTHSACSDDDSFSDYVQVVGPACPHKQAREAAATAHSPLDGLDSLLLVDPACRA